MMSEGIASITLVLLVQSRYEALSERLRFLIILAFLE